MVDITVVLGLQGRARRNARVAMLRLQRARDEAREAAAACAAQAQAAAPAGSGTDAHLDPRAPEWTALAERFQDDDVDQRALLLELMRRLRGLDVAAGEAPAQTAVDPALQRS